jgi:hypothetical protein
MQQSTEKSAGAQVKKGNFQGILLSGAWAGAAIRICGSAEPEAKEYFRLHKTADN